MRLTFTEIAGWILTIAGLGLVGLIVVLALNRNVFEAMALGLPAVIVFRGGLGMVRLATAGRIAKQLADEPANRTNSPIIP